MKKTMVFALMALGFAAPAFGDADETPVVQEEVVTPEAVQTADEPAPTAQVEEQTSAE